MHKQVMTVFCCRHCPKISQWKEHIVEHEKFCQCTSCAHFIDNYGAKLDCGKGLWTSTWNPATNKYDGPRMHKAPYPCRQREIVEPAPYDGWERKYSPHR